MNSTNNLVRSSQAVHVLQLIAMQEPDQRMSVRVLARILGKSEATVGNIMKGLVDVGMVHGRPGRSGGYKLACDPSRRSVHDVVEAMEESFDPVSPLGTFLEDMFRSTPLSQLFC